MIRNRGKPKFAQITAGKLNFTQITGGKSTINFVIRCDESPKPKNLQIIRTKSKKKKA